ncbi:MAG: AraC family ligand binding domain-containing protein, partial [Treponema sp.]|nr:AraC family ligand binding domain-containing protein [Treponema sp.]
MRIIDIVYVHKLIGGNRLTLHGRHHAHKENHEIHLFLEGSGTFLLNQSKYVIEGNRLFLTGPGEFHSILPDAIKSPISYYAVIFEPELPLDSETAALLDRGDRRYLDTRPQERFLVKELYNLLGKKHVRAAEYLLLSLLHRWYGEAPPGTAAPNAATHTDESGADES